MSMAPTTHRDVGLARLVELLLDKQLASQRDIYAANALAHPYTHAATKEEVVRKAYQLADAMLAGPGE